MFPFPAAPKEGYTALNVITWRLKYTDYVAETTTGDSRWSRARSATWRPACSKARVVRDMVAYVAQAEPALRQGDLSWCDAAKALHAARRGHPGSVPDLKVETFDAFLTWLEARAPGERIERKDELCVKALRRNHGAPPEQQLVVAARQRPRGGHGGGGR